MSDAEAVLAAALDRPAALGRGRLLCLDGPSGSGKSSLAEQVASLTEATVIATDDACPGWDGLPRLAAVLTPLLTELAADRPGHYRSYDWVAGRPGALRRIDPVPLVILEGVGSGHRSWAPLRSALAWVDAPLELRQQRAFARDGDSYREYWDGWAAAEAAYFAAEDPRGQADLLVETSS